MMTMMMMKKQTEERRNLKLKTILQTLFYSNDNNKETYLFHAQRKKTKTKTPKCLCLFNYGKARKKYIYRL